MSAGRRGRTVARLCGAAFLADMALYLTMTGAPYLALSLGAGPVALGLLSLARALPYSLTTVWAGGLTDRRERLRLARGSLVVGAAAVVTLAVAPSLALIYVLLAVVGLSLAFFWPAVQASLADTGASEVTGNLGWFNIGWSTGKAVGFLIGGFLLASLGMKPVFVVAALGVLGAGALIMRIPSAPPAPPDDERPAAAHDPRSPNAVEEISPERARRFRLAAWIGNSVAFGIGAVLNTHYPDWLEGMERGAALFGSYLGLIFGAQTVTFAVLARFTRWRFRVAPQILSQVPLIVVLVLLPRIENPVLILATAPWVGLGLGANYFASIFYSVHAPARRGRNAGAHEALLGVGAMVLPVAGGWVAAGLGRLDAPYYVAAAAGGLALLVQLGILARSGRGGDQSGREGESGRPRGYQE